MKPSNKLTAARMIRVAALESLNTRGTLTEVRGLGGRSCKAVIGDIALMLRTPFQRPPQPREEVKYFRALQQQRGYPASNNLAYGLNIWFQDRKVLELEWSQDDREIQVISFRRGDWEEALLNSGSVMTM